MRHVEKIYKTQPTLEGAGVHLKRGFGYHEVKAFDPFLLFDDFSNTEAAKYQNGFPLHPHRGIETVTYLLKGAVAHKDSLGNAGVIEKNQVQWMTAGSGIVHEEMPVVREEGIQGFQLWVNLPSKDKMMSPRYQDITEDEIKKVTKEGVTVRVIAGEYEGVRGSVQDLMVSPTYLDVALDADTQFSFKTPPDDTFFMYVFEGRVLFRNDRSESWVGEGDITLLTKDTALSCTSGKDGARFLLIGGTPLNESVSWAGPIVMNTPEEVQLAIEELNNGTFIKES